MFFLQACMADVNVGRCHLQHVFLQALVAGMHCSCIMGFSCVNDGFIFFTKQKYTGFQGMGSKLESWNLEVIEDSHASASADHPCAPPLLPPTRK